MPKQKSAQAHLVAVSNKQTNKVTALPAGSDFMRGLLHYPDVNAAAQILREQAGLEFDQSEDGITLHRLILEQEEIDAQFEDSKRTLAALQDKRRNTKHFVKSAYSPENTEHKVKPFWRWRALDQFSFLLLSFALIAAMGMGAANVYANLMASGEAVFIEHPEIAICLSLLVPAGSTAIKFITSFFEYDRTRKRYALCIYGLTVVSLLAWSVAFALNFTGVAGGLNLDDLEESNDHGSLLVWLQLSAELLMASALFLSVEEIYCKYNPDHHAGSPAYRIADEACQSYETKTHHPLAEKCYHITGQINRLKAKREAFINAQLVEFHALRARFNTIHQL